MNLYELNQHPGEVLTVEEPLYQALELLETYGNRNLYLGPVYEEMYNLFQCKEDYETASFDPEQNEVLREEFAVIADFAADPEAVDLKLLGEIRCGWRSLRNIRTGWRRMATKLIWISTG